MLDSRAGERSDPLRGVACTGWHALPSPCQGSTRHFGDRPPLCLAGPEPLRHQTSHPRALGYNLRLEGVGRGPFAATIGSAAVEQTKRLLALNCIAKLPRPRSAGKRRVAWRRVIGAHVCGQFLGQLEVADWTLAASLCRAPADTHPVHEIRKVRVRHGEECSFGCDR